ncbi:hypothetical protein ATB98_05875 [Sinorhizobium saheli]|uniref:Uncharacterized protein n=1 Tax=Sinorhizobium saheli TaxID=36856 RepID=A0A178Y3E0_SINSA|nr:hypothetical protein ATB98_05875 [Sinorhizobium saheli]
MSARTALPEDSRRRETKKFQQALDNVWVRWIARLRIYGRTSISAPVEPYKLRCCQNAVPVAISAVQI